MDIEADTRLLETAARHAVAVADGLRDAALTAGRLPTTVRDPSVLGGLPALADGVADACEVLALDLELLTRVLQAATATYRATETGLATGLAGPLG